MLATLKKSVQNAFHRLVDSAQTGLEALARSIARNGGEVLTAAAAAAVAAAEAQGGSGAAKFQAARAAVVAVLTAKGIPLVENAVQGAILAAVADLNA